jgi:D-glycero-beta-D-manno-heptose-7-phosphate kinase
VTAVPALPLIDPSDASRLGTGFHQASVVVVGDVMLDHFLVGRVERISPEAPVPIVAFEREEWRIGGAGNVAHNIAALGGAVHLVGVMGRDPSADRLKVELQAAGLTHDGLVIDDGRRTTTKVRVVTTRNQQVARVDYESDDEIAGETEAALLECTEAAVNVRAIVVSDYLKGVVTRRVMARLVDLSRRHGISLVVDPKIPHLDYYAGATLVTPNHHEAETATHRRIRTHAEAQVAAAALRHRIRSEGVLITRGEQGMWLLHGEYDGHLAATAREVADVTGAGDTVIATLALAMAAGATSAQAAGLASQAAGVVVGKFGPATLSASELLQACRT